MQLLTEHGFSYYLAQLHAWCFVRVRHHLLLEISAPEHCTRKLFNTTHRVFTLKTIRYEKIDKQSNSIVLVEFWVFEPCLKIWTILNSRQFSAHLTETPGENISLSHILNTANFRTIFSSCRWFEKFLVSCSKITMMFKLSTCLAWSKAVFWRTTFGFHP